MDNEKNIGRIEGSLGAYRAEILNPESIHNVRYTSSELFDRHYLLYCYEMGVKWLFGIEEENNTKEMDRRLYEKALELLSNCKIVDKTSHAISRLVSW